MAVNLSLLFQRMLKHGLSEKNIWAGTPHLQQIQNTASVCEDK
jgi:hypothetical protein